MNTGMTVKRLSFGFLTGLLVSQLAACDPGAVDPSLVGRWQLQGAALPVYWDIRADGSYTVSGPGAGEGHSGSFEAVAGTWSMQSSTWGDDGGSYQVPDPDTFVGTGRLGPAVWRRVGGPTVSVTATDDITLSMQSENGEPVPKDLPELLAQARVLSAQWRPDSIPVSIEYRISNAPNPAMRGPELQMSFVSPAEGIGERITLRERGVSRSVTNQAVNWGGDALPAVFVDLPAAVGTARKSGMSGPLISASLRTWKPGGSPVLAWMVSTSGSGGGRTVDATTGHLIEGDVTGYVAGYNAQWERAATGLRSLMRRTRGSVQADGSGISYSEVESGSSTPYDDGSSAREEADRNAAEARAYWRGSAEDYNRIKNGECSSSDNSNFGC